MAIEKSCAQNFVILFFYTKGQFLVTENYIVVF